MAGAFSEVLEQAQRHAREGSLKRGRGQNPSDGVDLAKLLKPFPIEWQRQEELFMRGYWNAG